MMRKLLLAGFIVSLAGVPATAGGDASYGTGKAGKYFYAGGVVGYGWGRHSSEGDEAKTRGLIGGAVIGYRILSGQGALAIEGDVLGSGIKQNLAASYKFDDGSFARADARFGTDVLASLRLKASWGKTSWQPYLTGGLAWQRLELKYDAQGRFEGKPKSHSETIKDDQFGFTLGAGVDWQTSDSYSVSLGYQYYRFENDVRGFDTSTDLHTLRLGGKLHY